MLTVHHLGNSQSERIVWLCEELGVPYELIRYEREPSLAAPPAFKMLHPAGTAPVITDGALVLAESGAIVEYVCRVHGGGRLLPGSDHPEFVPFLFWFHYASGSMMPALMMDFVAARYGASSAGPRTDRAIQLVEQRLGEAEWFAGDAFTAADIMMVFPITSAMSLTGRAVDEHLNVRDYLSRIGDRPAYRAAMAKAEPVGLASEVAAAG